MFVYQVYMEFFDGDRTYGSYESPLFSNKRAANRFLEAVTGKWWHAYSENWKMMLFKPRIIVMQVLDECPIDINPDDYLNTIHT